jgi:titin
MHGFYSFSGVRKPADRRSRPRVGLSVLERLEARQLLSGSTFEVINTNDSGPGSFRQAIINSNAATSASANTIDFQIGSSGAFTITLQSALPAVTQSVVIDGTSEPGKTLAPRIEIKGTNPGPLTAGITLDASNSTIKGLSIVGFTSDGIQINAASGDLIAGDYIGVTPAGRALGNDGNGVIIQGASTNNTIGGTTAGAGDVISGNFSNGVDITDDSSGNVIAGDLIGTNPAGSAAMANELSGVLITGTLADTSTSTPSNTNPSNNNLVGPGNVISGNTQFGVAINDGSAGNRITASKIGTDITGSVAVHNAYDGVVLSGTGTNHEIVGPGNVISGNWQRAVDLINGASDELVEGNVIGTSASISAYSYDIGNPYNAVVISPGSNSNTIGGSVSGTGNVISGNGGGIAIWGGSGNLVEGNWIGTNAFNARVGNATDGVLVSGATAIGTTIGGTAPGDRNVISGNGQFGVLIEGGSSHTVVQGNLIGTGVGGYGPLPNGWDGVGISTSTSNLIGGSVPGSTNLISGNNLWGVVLASGADETAIEGNLIGTNIVGTGAVANGWDGVAVLGSSAYDNTIGGTTTSAGNVISGNVRRGVYLSSGTHNNLVEGNPIGTNSQDNGPLGNGLSGVQIDLQAANNTIGGTTPGAGNTISDNGQNGVYLLGDGVKNPSGVGDDPGNVVEFDILEHNGINGVRINADPQDSALVLSCTIEFNGQYGIWENNSQTYYFIGSLVANNNGKPTNPQIYTNN